MHPPDFIKQRILSLKLVNKYKSTGNLPDDIYRIITSHNFRKYALPPEFTVHIKNVIHTSVSRKKPIPFVWVFGGYKLWSLKEAPEVDWAELFSLIYFTDWLKPITTIYKPGVWFDFFSDDVIVPIMNNIDSNDTSKYIRSFQNLLNFINPRVIPGIRFTLHRVADQYANKKEFISELDVNVAKITEERKRNALSLTPIQIATIDLNVKPLKDQLNDPSWRDKIQILHDAYSVSSKRRPYYRNTEKIMVLNTPGKGLIAVGTTKTSIVKFWVGKGVLEKRDDSFIERILSPKQIGQFTFKNVPINVPGLIGKNFSEISIATPHKSI